MAPFDLSSIVASPWFTAWQRAAADSMAAAARDPRLMRLGAGMLRSQLLMARAWQTAWQAAWAPIDALADRPSSNS
jgi:hypothetical protein